MGWMTKGSWFYSWLDEEIFLFFQIVQTGPETHSASISFCAGALFPPG
jgi:hypothetical protein